MKKYELTNERLKIGIYQLYRIRALKDFADVKKGDLGGFVESEFNLSQVGDCWVYDDACVYGNAHVSQNATIRDDATVFCVARVCGNATIKEQAFVTNNSVVCDRAIIFGEAIIAGHSQVYGNAKIGGHMVIRGEVHLDSGHYEDSVVFDW